MSLGLLLIAVLRTAAATFKALGRHGVSMAAAKGLGRHLQTAAVAAALVEAMIPPSLRIQGKWRAVPLRAIPRREQQALLQAVAEVLQVA